MRKTQTNHYKNKLSLIIYWLQLFLDLNNYQVSKQSSSTGYLSPGPQIALGDGQPSLMSGPRRWSCLFFPDPTSTSWTSWSSFLLSWINPLYSCYLLLTPTLASSLWSHWLRTSSSVWEMQSLSFPQSRPVRVWEARRLKLPLTGTAHVRPVLRIRPVLWMYGRAGYRNFHLTGTTHVRSVLWIYGRAAEEWSAFRNTLSCWCANEHALRNFQGIKAFTYGIVLFGFFNICSNVTLSPASYEISLWRIFCFYAYILFF